MCIRDRLYLLIYFFPEPFVKTITEQTEVRNVSVTDTGIADAVDKLYDAVVVVKTYTDGQLYATGTGFVSVSYTHLTPNATYRKKSDFDHRIKIINHSNATYYLSIHLNYLSSSSYSGPQVFYSSVLDENQELALQDVYKRQCLWYA